MRRPARAAESGNHLDGGLLFAVIERKHSMETGNLFTLSVDLLLIIRAVMALSWGIILAVLIQYWSYGKFVAAERTWFSVAVGVGIDLLIAWRSSWEATCIVIAFSSVGIIFRSIINESNRTGEERHPYHARKFISMAIKELSACLKESQTLLADSPSAENLLSLVARTIARLSNARESLRLAELNVPIDNKTE